MTDADLHREEFIIERIGMILDDEPGLALETANRRAIDIWDTMQELSRNAQELADGLDGHCPIRRSAARLRRICGGSGGDCDLAGGYGKG